MKSACRAAALGVALAAAVLPGRADNGPSAPLAAPALQPPPNIALTPTPDTASFTGGNPNAVVEQSMQVRENFEREITINQNESAARQQAYDADWMLRNYNASLQAQGLQTSADREEAAAEQVPNPAGPLSDPQNPPASPLDPAKSPPSSRANADDKGTDIPPADTPSALVLQPLLPPLAHPTDATTITRLDAWGSTTVDNSANPNTLSSTLFGSHDLRNPYDGNSTSTETEMDVPGLTAERQGLGDSGDLNLPDQQMESAAENADTRARKDFLLPTVAANDSTDFFRRQSEALAPPNSNAALHPITGNILLPPTILPPAPSAKIPVTTGIRSHVPDPFDLIGGHRDPTAPGTW